MFLRNTGFDFEREMDTKPYTDTLFTLSLYSLQMNKSVTLKDRKKFQEKKETYKQNKKLGQEMFHEVILGDISISKALAVKCQPVILFRDVRNYKPEVEGSWEEM